MQKDVESFPEENWGRAEQRRGQRGQAWDGNVRAVCKEAGEEAVGDEVLPVTGCRGRRWGSPSFPVTLRSLC